MKNEELFKLIAMGESETVEFKSEINKDLPKEICALANYKGGKILLGVDDNGKIIGIDWKKDRERFYNLINAITPPVTVSIREYKIGKKTIILVEVPKSKALCSVGNVAYVRVGTSKRPLSLQEVLMESVERLLITADKIETAVEIKEIDHGILKTIEERRKKLGKEMKVMKYLEQIGAIHGKKLSLGGALFLAKEPQKYFPFSYLRYKEFGGNWKRINGPIPKIVEKSLSIVEKYMMQRSVIVKGIRYDIVNFPIEAIREGIVNALVHRNYAVESEVFLEISPNELIIRNPGGFPPGVSPENPKPVPRNPLIYELAHVYGLVEKEGSGILKIKSLCEENGLDVEYVQGELFLELRIKKPEILNQRQTMILNLLKIKEMGSSEIAKVLGVSKVTVLEDLKALMVMGKIKKVGEGKYIRYGLA